MATTLRLHTSTKDFPLKTGKVLQELAMKWNYIVSQRSRWRHRDETRAKLATDAARDLAKVGLKNVDLPVIANAGVVEVSIQFKREDVEWESRIFPWEYVLSAVTRDYRLEKSFLVVRHLERSKRASAPKPPANGLFIETAPEPFRDKFDFDTEFELVNSAVRPMKPERLCDPTTIKLRRELVAGNYDFIHLTGIDARLGAQLLKQESTKPVDGIYFAHSRKRHELLNAQDVAILLNTAKNKPRFVGFNCWDSGSRIAALTVAEGAGAALGFQNTFDDRVAELFFVNFYSNCADNGWDPLASFRNAWQSTKPYRERIRGSSIVLWSATSLVPREEGRRRRRRAEKLVDSEPTIERSADPKREEIRDLVTLEVVPDENINYASLHNGRSLFKKFSFVFTPPQRGTETTDDSGSTIPVGRVRDIEVEVCLNFGTDSFPFRTKVYVGHDRRHFDLADANLRLPAHDENPSGGIRVALTSELARSVDETIQTSLYVKVCWHGQVLHQHTYPVCLHPVDQWRLDDRDIKWLPSFVQPRDPAVARIIQAAQQHLKCLADYAGAGFDGYQSSAEEGNLVDAQVRAIWSAIAFDRSIGYINPPPSYTESTQRLRTPLQIEQQGRGTCIDLTLLLASCLEWIEIYPVVFMLDDHAFPGYWKDEASYEKFFEIQEKFVPREEDTPAEQGQEVSIAQGSASWIIPRSAYREIREYVLQGMIIPLESVFMTSASGYQEAVEEGKSYFRLMRHPTFHSMIDVRESRKRVTPLPLCVNE